MANKNTRSALTKAFSFVDLSHIPGPRGMEYIKYVNFFQNNILGAFSQVGVDYGDIASFPWPMNSIIIYSPEFARQILVERHKKYIKGEQIEEMRAVVGTGLATNNDYPSWLRSRTIVAKEFNSKAVEGFVSQFGKWTDKRIESWRTHGSSAIDACEEMKFLTFEIACATLLGSHLDVSDAHKVNEAVKYTAKVSYERIFQFFPLPYWLPTSTNLKFNRHYNNLDSIVMRLINDEKARDKTHAPSSVLERLVHAKDPESGTGLSDEELRDEVLTLMLAGHETSAHTLTWIIGLLAKHQDKQKRLQSEIDSSSEHSLQNINEQIPFLHWIILEGMRLYPAFPVLSRKCATEDHLGPYRIPPKTNVVIPIFVIQTLKENWAAPKQFMPERFEDESLSKNVAYMPFSKGPRKCLAEHFALTEMGIILYKIFKSFDVELVNEDLPMAEAYFSLKPVGGMKVVLRPRS